MEAGYLEKFECPICCEIPEKEIFQCQNGHTLCSKCEPRVTLCPQCKVGIENPKIRNRVLEELLDKTRFDCEFKSAGCTRKLKRNQIKSHRDSCKYNPAANTADICKPLGYSCGHVSNLGKLLETVGHFKTVHGFQVSESSSVSIHLDGFTDENLQRNSMWNPVVIDRTQFNGRVFLILSLSNDDDMTISFICLELKDSLDNKPQSPEMYFRIDSVDPEKDPHITWHTSPSDAKYAASVIKDPVFRFSKRILQEKYTCNTALLLNVTCNDGSTQEVADKSETLTTFNIQREIDWTRPELTVPPFLEEHSTEHSRPPPMSSFRATPKPPVKAPSVPPPKPPPRLSTMSSRRAPFSSQQSCLPTFLARRQKSLEVLPPRK